MILDKEKNKILIRLFYFVIFSLFLFFYNFSFAAYTNIDSVYKYAWSENIGWIVFNTDEGGVVVSDDQITGYVWNDNFGWINLNPSTSGVKNDGKGNLSGYAWGDNIGWINFSGVKIDSEGYFYGYATGDFTGRISFNCSNGNSCNLSDFKVRTTWRPTSSSSGPSGPSEEIKWCEKEQKYILKSQWTEERCNINSSSPPSSPPPPPPPPSSPPSSPPPPPPPSPSSPHLPAFPETPLPSEEIQDIRWCEKEKSFIPLDQWSEKRCSEFVWCSSLKKYILTEEWNSQKCETSVFSFAKETFDKIKTFFKTPVVSTTTQGVAGLGLMTMVLRTLLVLPPLLRRKNINPWGTVYDSVTKQPLDPAYVVLKNAKGEEINSSITDIDGRYGFLIADNLYESYRMIASKTNYTFPSQKLKGKTNDEIYNNLYFGESFTIKKEEGVIIRDIPLDPIGFDWNEFIKKKKKLFTFYSRFDFWLKKIYDAIFAIGFVLSIIFYSISPSKFNLIMLFMYIAVFLLRLFNIKPKTYGLIIDKLTKTPLFFAIIRVFQAEIDKEIFVRVADKLGRYYILVPKGKYYLKIEKKNDDGTYSLVYTSKIINAKKGIINNKFEI